MQTHHEMPPINILPVNKISVSVEEASQVTGIPAATLNVWRCQGRGQSM
ncbi:hypothetical protein ACQ0P8_05735 [Halodesulfovibrio aestuarii]|uniref:Uncharacterized protein n=1 Tax=Halodesulfovibrio aestuarii TaxID=126333 RepID=A0A8G2FC43_9BACT|nr:hypothetical protein [Halodesulfovibrio aestuarii]SHJ59948.1 hypothetical protein SAMN05660830_02789 [Halodesulfovibrio aestuarii]